MSEYVVRWEIDVTAETFEEAAREAQRAQRDPETTANVFEVWLATHFDDPDDKITVDLDEENG